jgi:cytochrome P450
VQESRGIIEPIQSLRATGNVKIAHKEKMEKNGIKGCIPKGPSEVFFKKNAWVFEYEATKSTFFKTLFENYSGVVSYYKSDLAKRIYFVGKTELIEKIHLATAYFFPIERHENNIVFSQALLGKGMVATNMDAEWRSHRQSLARSFNPTYVFNNYYRIIEDSLTKIIDDFSKNTSLINIAEKSIIFSGSVLSTLISPQHTLSNEDFIEIFDTVDKAYWGIGDLGKKDRTTLLENKKNLLFKKMENLFDNFIANKHQNDNCLLSIMYHMFENNFDETAKNKILGQCLNLIVAGSDGLQQGLSAIFYLLAQHPEKQNRLYAELKDFVTPISSLQNIEKLVFLNNIIKESIRLYPSIIGDKEVKKTCVIDGVKFIKNSIVVLIHSIANRDSSEFSFPNTFNPDRFEKEKGIFFPFGHGPRVCIGKALGELMLRLAVIRLIKEFSFEPLGEIQNNGVLECPLVQTCTQFKIFKRD